jgi:uncharacterized membrane protein YbhN (UPF0104 family)
MQTEVQRRERRRLAHASAEVQPAASSRSRKWYWLLAGLVAAALAVGAARLDWTSVVAVLSTTDAGRFAVVCGILMLLPVLTAVEWRLINARAAVVAGTAHADRGGEFGMLFSVSCLTYFLQTYLNAAVGYGTALWRLVRGRGWSAGQAIGLVTVDQVSEGISRIVFCGLVLSSAAAAYALSPAGVGLVFLATVGATYVVAAHGKWLVRRSVSQRLARMGHHASVLEDALAVIRLRGFAWGIGLAMLKKVVKLGAIYAAERALGFEGSPLTAVYFLAALDCATVLPLVPGHLGVMESTAATVYAAHGHSAEVGLSIGILYHAGLYLATALMGLAAMAPKALGPRDEKPA